MHEAGVRSKAPEWRSSDLVSSIVDGLIRKAGAIHDPVHLSKGNLGRLLWLVKRPDRFRGHCIVLDDGNGDAIPGANIVEQEVAVRMKSLFSQSIGNRELASIYFGPGLGGCKGAEVAGSASDAGKKLRAAFRRFGCRQSLVPRRHFRSAHETGKAIDIFQAVGGVRLIVRLSD